MTQLEKSRSLSYLKLGMVLFTTVVFFAYGSWKLIAENIYTHVTIERYHQDNESITEAFKQKAALNRHLEKELSEHRMQVEVQEEIIFLKDKELKASQEEIKEIEESFFHLQQKYQQTQHEKDSLIALISALRRAE
jgi:septal ring factor EnvC (AmiA/AmiB activator)